MAGTSVKLASSSGDLFDLATGLVLMRALEFVGLKRGTKASTAAERLQVLLQALADDARNASGQHQGTSGLEVLRQQLTLVTLELEKDVRREILEFDEVQRLYRRLAELQGTPPWLFRVDQVTGVIALVTLEEASSHPALRLALSAEGKAKGSSVEPLFTLSGAATAELLLDVLTAEEANASLALSPPLGPTERAVQLKASGALQMDAGASISAPVTATVSVGGTAEAGMDLLFDFDKATQVIEALARVANASPEPSALSSIARNLAPVNVRGLRRVGYRVGAGGKLAFSMSVADASTSATSLVGASGPMPVKTTLGIKATAGFGFGKGIERTVVVDRSASGELRVHSTIKRTRSQEVKAGLDIGFSFDGLDAWATSWLERVLPGIPPQISKVLEAYANPGKKLAEALEASLGQNRAQLVLLLLGQTTAEDAASALLAPLQEAFDSVENAFDSSQGRSQDLVARAAAILSEQSGGRVSAARIAPLLEKPMAAAWSAVLGAFRTDLTKAFQQASKQLTNRLSQSLAPLSDALGGKTVIDSAQQLVSHAQGVLKKYSEVRKRVFEEVSQALTSRVAFSLAYARADTIEAWLSRHYTMDASGWSAARWKGVDGAYRRLLQGQAEGFQAATGAAINVDLGAKGSTSRTTTVTLDLMPFKALWKADRRATAQVLASPTGELRSASGTLENRESAGKATVWNVGFAGALGLLDARLGDGLPVAPMGIEVSAAFARISPNEVREFFTRLAGVDDLTANELFGATLEHAAERVRSQAGGGKNHALRVSFGLVFPDDQLDVFTDACLSMEGGQRFAEMLLTARANMPGTQFEKALAYALSLYSDALGRPCQRHELFFAYADAKQAGLPKLVVRLRKGEQSLVIGGKSHPLGGFADGMFQLEKALVAWKNLRAFAEKISNLPAAVQALSRRLANAGDADKVRILEEGVADLLERQAQANSNFGHVLDPSDAAATGVGLAPDTSALLAFTAEALGRDAVQRPAESLRLFFGAPADRPDQVNWQEIR